VDQKAGSVAPMPGSQIPVGLETMPQFFPFASNCDVSSAKSEER
jgi:hypothetical protein